MKTDPLEHIGKDPVQAAKDMFSHGFNCCQAAFIPFIVSESPQSLEKALKMSAIFGGGMGRTGQTCGAISGAMMALGWNRGFAEPNSSEKKEALYVCAQQWMALFNEVYAETTCPGLTGFDLADPEQRVLASQAGISEKCLSIVETAARVTKTILDQSTEK